MFLNWFGYRVGMTLKRWMMELRKDLMGDDDAERENEEGW